MSNENKLNKKMIHTMIMLVIMIGFRFLPPIGQITPVGMQVAGIFIGGIYGWVTIGLLLPSLCGIVLIGLTDMITTTDFLAKGFGSQTFALVVGMMVIAAFIQQSNLSQIIIKTMMNVKFAQGRPWITLLCLLFAVFAVASVSNSLIACLLFLPLYTQMVESVNMPKYSKLNNAMITGMAFAGFMGDVTMPYQVMVVMIASSFTGATGIAVDLGRYMLAFLPWSIFMICLYIAICKYVFRIDASALQNANVDFGNAKITKRQSVSLCFILFALILLVIPNFLPKEWIITQMLTTLGSGGTVLLALLIMAIIYVDGEPLLDISKTAKGISWDMLFMAAYFAPVASMLTSDVAGIKVTIASVLQPFLVGLHPIMIVIMIAILGTVLTNFMNNMVIAIIMVSTLGILGDFLGGYSLVAIMAIIIFCCDIAYILPSAAPTNAFMMSQTELIQFKAQFKHAILSAVIMIVLTLTLGLAWFGILL